MEIRQGDRHVANINHLGQMRFGGHKPFFAYHKGEMVYPNPVKDGLLLWYDFKGMTNNHPNKEIAQDLSGNGNNGSLQNFNFTAESGYNKNKLLFDGIDDSLTIPELNLNETGMSVQVDGKVYSYEDDKVLTLGEDGEIVGSGKKNYYALSQVSGGRLALPVKPNTDYTVSSNSPAPNTPVETAIYFNGLTYSVNGVWEGNHRTINSGDSTEMYVHIYLGRPYREELLRGDYWIMWEEGSYPTPWTPAPEDYKTTTLSPSSMSDLKLYNKPLRKDELLHNAESKGLKTLKDGVVVQDGLVLHYDFSKESNVSEYKDKAFDYSGNQNHGTLNNFAYTDGSGYQNGGLKFDGVDDEMVTSNPLSNQTPENQSWSVELVLKTLHLDEGTIVNKLVAGINLGLDFRKLANDSEVTALNYIANSSVSYMYALSRKVKLDEVVHIVFSYNSEKLENRIVINADHVDKMTINFETHPPTGMQKNLTFSHKKNDFYITRIYNRPLTPEEIQHNYQIEKERFNLE